MNRDDIIRMAREAGGDDWGIFRDFMPEIERFAALVAAAERERIKWDSIHSCHPHCDRPACLAVRRAREDEREMCAKVCEAFSVDRGMIRDETLKTGVFSGASMCALAIRERGAP